MRADSSSTSVRRAPLSRDRVLRAAVQVADAGGIEALTMRGIADELGVEAMSLYHHVANKEAILDGVVDVVVAEAQVAADAVAPLAERGDWQSVMRARILAAREVMLAHPWAPDVIESRTSISPATVRWFDSLLGVLRMGGFSWDLCHHAMHALGSRALGFAPELFEPDDPDGAEDETMAMLAEHADEFPNLVGMLSEVVHEHPDSTLGWCDSQSEFEFGLDLLLDGLERRPATH